MSKSANQVLLPFTTNRVTS